MTDTAHQIKALKAQAKIFLDMLDDLEKSITPNPRLLFCSPVTGKIEQASNPFGGDWFDATGFCKLYNSSGVLACHTGVDLNRPNYADAGASVYAMSQGRVVFNSVVPGWQGDVIVIEHTLEDGSLIWTRYAHIKAIAPYGASVKSGDVIGVIADYNRDGPKGDHVHIDVCHIDLGREPGDWPGHDAARVTRDYIDPALWLRERAQ